MIFVDTNYFLRFLLEDINTQHRKAKTLFREGAEGKIELTTSLVVFFEVYWVLSSFYEKERAELVEILNKLLKMEFIQLEGRPLLRKAVRIFAEKNFDLEDAFNLVYAKGQGVSDFKTFDKNLAREFKRI